MDSKQEPDISETFPLTPATKPFLGPKHPIPQLTRVCCVKCRVASRDMFMSAYYINHTMDTARGATYTESTRMRYLCDPYVATVWPRHHGIGVRGALVLSPDKVLQPCVSAVGFPRRIKSHRAYHTHATYTGSVRISLGNYAIWWRNS